MPEHHRGRLGPAPAPEPDGHRDHEPFGALPAEPRRVLEAALYEAKRVIVGQDSMLERLLVAVLAGGHVLLEGVPGLAKTLTVKTLAGVVGGSFSRVQFTPDLVPSDLVGTRIWRPDTGEFQTDGHLDVDAVRAGAVLVCPVKLDGGGVYLGDMHALQGDGEIAGHTCDVSGTVTLEVEVLKGLAIDGPLLFPVAEDLPFLARPLSYRERQRALQLARRHGVDELEESLPISVIGTGPDLNSATDNGLARAAVLLDMSVPEVKNRATIAGAIEIGRHPGVVQVTLRAPADRLEARGLAGYAREQSGQV